MMEILVFLFVIGQIYQAGNDPVYAILIVLSIMVPIIILAVWLKLKLIKKI